MRASRRRAVSLCAVVLAAGSASTPFLGLGCGSGDDESGTNGKPDATADGSSGRADSAVDTTDSATAPPEDGGDGSTVDAAIVCPTSAPADLSDAAVAAACTRFLYLAGGDNTRVIASVDEGATWASQEYDNTTGDDVINNFAVYRGITSASSLPGVFQSSDPTAGFNDGGPDAGDAGITFSPVTSIARGGFSTYGGQFAVNASGVFFTDNQGTYLTHDETSWARLDGGGFGGHWSGTAASDTTYVVLQDDSKFRTYDGTTLTDGTLPITIGNGNHVTYGGGMFVVAGGTMFTTSADGKTWSAGAAIASADGGSYGHPSTILWDGAQYLLYSYSSQVVVSPDTKSWTAKTSNARIDVAANSEGHFVATGVLGKDYGILLSSDGITWRMGHVFGADETAKVSGWRVAVGRVLK